MTSGCYSGIMTLWDVVKKFTVATTAAAVVSGIVPTLNFQKPNLTSLLKPANACAEEIAPYVYLPQAGKIEGIADI